LIFTLRSANKTNIAATSAAVAANKANEILRREQRPWVTLIREFHCDFMDRGGFQGEINFNYNLTNKGKSPAHAVQIHSKIFKFDDFPDVRAVMRDYRDVCAKLPPNFSKFPIIFPSETTDMRRNLRHTSFWEVGPEGKRVVAGDFYLLVFCIRYQLSDDPDDSTGWEVSAYKIEARTDTIGPFGHELRSFSNYRIVE
jgi:hypothetical protein